VYSARCKKCGLVEREAMGCVGSSIPVAIFKVMQQPQLYRMYAIQRQFNQDKAKSYKGFKHQREEKRQ
jgi:hypothetical protein